MKCKAVLREIEELERGAKLSVEANEHLLACAPCRAFADERSALRLLLGSLDGVSAPGDFDWRLRERLAQVRNAEEDSRGWLSGFAPSLKAITVAASITVLLVGVSVYRQIQTTERGERSAAVAANIKGEDKVAAVVNPPTEAQAGSIKDSAPREAARTRGNRSTKSNGVKTEAASQPAPASEQRIYSRDFGSRGAEDLTTAANSYTGAGPVISVRVPSPKAAQLRFEDGQGTKRTLAPVSFGGQEMIDRPDKARLVPVSEKGIW